MTNPVSSSSWSSWFRCAEWGGLAAADEKKKEEDTDGRDDIESDVDGEGKGLSGGEGRVWTLEQGEDGCDNSELFIVENCLSVIVFIESEGLVEQLTASMAAKETQWAWGE